MITKNNLCSYLIHFNKQLIKTIRKSQSNTFKQKSFKNVIFHVFKKTTKDYSTLMFEPFKQIINNTNIKYAIKNL